MYLGDFRGKIKNSEKWFSCCGRTHCNSMSCDVWPNSTYTGEYFTFFILFQIFDVANEKFMYKKSSHAYMITKCSQNLLICPHKIWDLNSDTWYYNYWFAYGLENPSSNLSECIHFLLKISYGFQIKTIFKLKLSPLKKFINFLQTDIWHMYEVQCACIHGT